MKHLRAYRSRSLKFCIAGLFLAGLLLLTVYSTLAASSLLSGSTNISLVLNKDETCIPEKEITGEEEYSETCTNIFSGGQRQPYFHTELTFNYITDIQISISGIPMDIFIPPPKPTGGIA